MHPVLLFTTSAWRGAGTGYAEIDRGTLLQMMGRAGRPGFDTNGVAVIMTDNASVKKYNEMSRGMEVVESNLFYVRVRKNSKFYGIQGKNEQQMNSYLKQKCMQSVRLWHARYSTDFV